MGKDHKSSSGLDLFGWWCTRNRSHRSGFDWINIYHTAGCTVRSSCCLKSPPPSSTTTNHDDERGVLQPPLLYNTQFGARINKVGVVPHAVYYMCPHLLPLSSQINFPYNENKRQTGTVSQSKHITYIWEARLHRLPAHSHRIHTFPRDF